MPPVPASEPTVSILPAYNSGVFINETVDSALGQTFAHFEALVSDDGSTDNTADVVAAYAARDPRIRLIRQSNGGLAVPRNSGIAQAPDRRRARSLSADEASMRRGIAATLMQLRDARLDHAGDVAAIDAQLARLRQRELLIEAREVIHGDVSALERHLAILAASSGAGRYRVPRQVAAVTPPAVFRWGDTLKQIVAVRRRARRISMLCIWP